jgi:hypothetical protein
MNRSVPFLLSVFMVTVPLPAASGPEWLDRCMTAVQQDTRGPRAAEVYCRCMEDIVGADEMLQMRQTDLERSFPPAHRRCLEKAGWKRPTRM